MRDEEIATVYGVHHSPWVQGVMMALHARGVSYRLVSHPPSWASYRECGLVMPQCRWHDGEVTSDSFNIMRRLAERIPEGAMCSELTHDHQERLERLFLSYVLARTSGRRSPIFVATWSRMPSTNLSLRGSLCRALMSLYFLILILVGRRLAIGRGLDPSNVSGLNTSLAGWSEQLGSENFLGGRTPGLIDFALFGHIQCMTSGLTDACIPILKSQSSLAAWVERMQTHLGGYEYDFSRRIFESDPPHLEAHWLDQTMFWLGIILAVLCLPITCITLLDAFRRRRKNPHSTGGKLKSD